MTGSAKQSSFLQASWIASSLSLLAMTEKIQITCRIGAAQLVLWPIGKEERAMSKISAGCDTPTSQDEAAIRSLIDRWARAVREEDRAAIRSDHDPDMLMFDVPPPLVSRGLDAYMATWEMFFHQVEKPVAFSFRDVKVTCGADVAFATAIGKCVDIDSRGKREPLEFRLTMGLRKLEGRWRVMHEHHSLPAT
jgi:uncharacterized protein (TIGR02246 family)